MARDSGCGCRAADPHGSGVVTRLSQKACKGPHARKIDAAVGRVFRGLRRAGQGNGRRGAPPPRAFRRFRRHRAEGRRHQGSQARRRQHRPPGLGAPNTPVHHPVRWRGDPPPARPDRRCARSHRRDGGKAAPLRGGPGPAGGEGPGAHPRAGDGKTARCRPADARDQEPGADPRLLPSDQDVRERRGRVGPRGHRRAVQERRRPALDHEVEGNLRLDGDGHRPLRGCGQRDRRRGAGARLMLAIVILLIALALVFDFINGFHDAANSIATVVSTRVLSPGIAVVWAAFFNFIAAFGGGVKVANTMGKGVIQFEMLKSQGTAMVLSVIFASLVGAILWNLLTWWWGLPSSSSHALAGGPIGGTLPAPGVEGLGAAGNLQIALFIVLSPLIGMALGTVAMMVATWIVHRRAPSQVDKWFRRLQLLSSGIFSYSHGTNDAQKTMGIIAVVLYGTLWANRPFGVPFWGILICHAAIGLGTAFGGWRIVRTMGHSLTKLQPIGGFSAETGGGVTILAISRLGIPVSTTHTITGAIVGVGATRGTRAVRWGIAGRIVWAWVLTIPAAGAVAAAVCVATRSLPALL